MDVHRIPTVYILLIYTEACVAKSTKVFWSGNSQAVRIPREFLIGSDEVEISRDGDTILLRPRKSSWRSLVESLNNFTEDFMAEGRNQPAPQSRKAVR
jgi:antitoxin VapB